MSYPLIFHDVKQNDPEWFKLKAGKISASNMKHVMAHYGKQFGEPAKRYAKKLALEQITGEYIRDEYHNSAMDRGHVDEPIATSLYESETFTTVLKDGIYISDDLAYSPDGRLFFNEETGRFKSGIEIKSRNYDTHYNNISRGGLPPEDKWQCISGLKFSGFESLDFISYCDAFPGSSKLFIHTITPDMFDLEFSQIDERLEQFKNLISDTKKVILHAMNN